jgi:hypothetical protein
MQTLKTVRGQAAWDLVLKLRYSPGRSRQHVKNLYKTYPKTDSLLILYHDKAKKTVEYRFFLNKDHMDPNDEGDLNMFGAFYIEGMNEPDLPAFLRKNYTFLLGLLD